MEKGMIHSRTGTIAAALTAMACLSASTAPLVASSGRPMSTTIAQALLEKGLLDGAIAGVSSAVDAAGAVFQERPWLAIVVALIVGLLIFSRRP
jgi:hypothetical protein